MLQTQHLSIFANATPLVQQASVALRAGEFVAICGANGAGKSTLLHALAGEPCQSIGKILLDDRPLTSWNSQHLARRRAFLSQHHEVGFTFRVEEVVLLGRYPYQGFTSRSRDCEIVRTTLSLVHAEHLMHREYMTLSGGEQARVQLARVLAQLWQDEISFPCYLLLDEPTAALDLLQQHILMSLIKRQTRITQLGVFIVLHDLNLASQYADRIILVANGRVQKDGVPADVLTSDNISACFGVDSILIKPPEIAHQIVVVTI